MKKVLSLVLVLVLCVGTALAASVPSITVVDVTTPVVQVLGQYGNTVSIIIREDNTSNAQLRNLQSSDKDEYFGDIIKKDNSTAKLSALLDPADINEFASIFVRNYNRDYGDLTVRILYRTTVYAMTDKLIVLIGLMDGGLTWYAFDAQVVDNQGRIEVVFPADILEKIQSDNGGLIAIASQSAAAGASAGSSGAPAEEDPAAPAQGEQEQPEVEIVPANPPAEEEATPAEEGPSAGSPGAPAGNEE